MIKDGQTCDTITLCVGSSVTLSTSFLYSQQGQRGVLSAASPGFTGFSVIDTTTATNSIGTIKVKITPTAGDAGVHVLNIKAADKNFPALTNTRPFVVVVNICTDIADAVRSDNFGIYPNPGTGNFTIQIDDKQLAASCEARIFDVLGNVVYAGKPGSTNTAVDLSDRANGFYFLSLYSEGALIGKEKFIIQSTSVE
ncbi:MAG: T9SS type A sorting domain-containing protein [Bacteroidetes bacterium]|nr:T9SS type A sorting domain-containing protein [Bacteroidota bacterium]